MRCFGQAAMRIELSGSLVILGPVVLTFTENQNFFPLVYISKGYTNFDLICVGGAGGGGGGIDTSNTGTLLRSFGGSGGGGGIHRVRGVLSALPVNVPVVIGLGGAKGSDHSFDPNATTDGLDGGASTFNGTTCMASGGLGGSRVQSNSDTTSTFADGGQGGVGGQTTPGGGAAGGTAGTPTALGPGTLGTPGQDGTWDGVIGSGAGVIGSGGGGGAGGVGKYGTATTCNYATDGGKGAYNASDPSAYAVGGFATEDPITSALGVVPGYAGGAKASLVSNMPTAYGSSSPNGPGNNGIVVVSLTAV